MVRGYARDRRRTAGFGGGPLGASLPCLRALRATINAGRATAREHDLGCSRRWGLASESDKIGDERDLRAALLRAAWGGHSGI